MLVMAFMLILVAGNVYAENILMARSPNSFDITLQVTKKSLEEHGYTVAHIQRCDTGLGDVGLKTDRYRLLFIGKPDEIRSLTKKYPKLIPYVPLKMAVYAEENESLVAIFNPENLSRLFPQRDLRVQFSRWKSDFESILEDVGK